MELVKNYLTENPCYKANLNPGNDARYLNFQKNGPRGFMLHSVGCAQPNASVFIKGWNSSTYNYSCVHGIIDANSGKVYQTLPWNFRGWHGGGTSNNTHVGVEMCEPDCIKYTGGPTFTCSNLARAQEMVRRTYRSAVELFAMLCKEYHKDPLADGVIISHREGHARGIATNHGDPEHLWNQLKTGYTMDGFRKDVKKEMEKSSTKKLEAVDKLVKNGVINTPDYWNENQNSVEYLDILLEKLAKATSPNVVADVDSATAAIDRLVEYGIINTPDYWLEHYTDLKYLDLLLISAANHIDKKLEVETKTEETFSPYKVRVSVNILNVRNGVGLNYKVVTQIKSGEVYTITEEKLDINKEKWGHLKSGAGWICLKYTEKI